jgi:hypothetical protein
MPQFKITLSEEDYKVLLDELGSLHGYHWNDDHVHADDCGSKVIDQIRNNTEVTMGTVEQLLPDFFANIQGNYIEQYLADIRKAEVETTSDARKLINSRLDATIAWVNSFKQPES